MKYKRIIARLDIKGQNLVKGIHMEGLRVIGNGIPGPTFRVYEANFLMFNVI